MSRSLRTAWFALLLVGVATLSVHGSGAPVPALPSGVQQVGHHAPALACEPGYTIVEEIVYQQVMRKVCKVVPEVKKHKKIVYCTKTEDYCLKKCPGLFCCGGQGCKDCGMGCERPRCKTVLLKKEVIHEECDYKCVVECVVDVVPIKVYRKVPCAQAPVAPHAGGLAPAPGVLPAAAVITLPPAQ